MGIQKISKHLPSLPVTEKQSSSTKPDEWVLTKQEEEEAIRHAIKREKEWMVNRMRNLHFLEAQIECKLKSIDFNDRIDRDKILRTANANKLQNIWHNDQRLRRQQKEEEFKRELKEKCSPEYLMEVLRVYAAAHSCQSGLIEDSATLPLIRSVIDFITEQPAFEEAGYSLNKGLLVRGVSGVGKTFVFKALKDNPLKPIDIYNMLEIEEDLKQTGTFSPSFHKPIVLIDDVGTETVPVKHFGTEINWFKTFIERIYLTPVMFKRIVVTTNISFAEMEERYSARVRSRMREMFNVIDVDGTDLRK